MSDLPAAAPPPAAIACRSEQSELGEGVRWDCRRGGELLRVDILAGRVFRERIGPDGDLVPMRTYDLPGTVGAIAPVADDDGWLIAADRGFIHLRLDGSYRVLPDVSPPGTRMNDAACDISGRLWAGTLADDHHEGAGALYRLDHWGRCEVMLEGLTISNGLGWSPDGRTMYLVDSGPRVIYAFTFDPVAGTISQQRVLVSIADEIGAPDGMTVDARGDLWVAIYGGGRVHRYSPDGELRDVLHTPPAQTTCCGFAGPGLSSLYVTTATEGWTSARRAAEPDAGPRVPIRHRSDRAGGRGVPPGTGMVAVGDLRIDRHRRLVQLPALRALSAPRNAGDPPHAADSTPTAASTTHAR